MTVRRSLSRTSVAGAVPDPIYRSGERPLRILVLAPHPFLEQRGTPLAVRALLEVLAARGCEIDLLTYEHGEPVSIPNCTIHRIRSPFGVRNIRPGFSVKKVLCDVAMIRKVVDLVRHNEYDLIHAVEESAFMAILAKRLRRIPFIYDMDSSLAQQLVETHPALGSVRPLLEAAERWAVRESSGVMAVCRSIEETASGHEAGKLVARIEDVSMLDPDVQGSERIADTIRSDGPVVMYVGNLEKYQGIDLLIESFRIALQSVADAQLVVIGGAANDVQRYRAHVNRIGIGRSVHFLGPRPVSLLAWYLPQATVVVSPRTRGYNTPMKIYSYLDSGRPLLATRLLTHTQVLDDTISMLAQPTPAAMGAAMTQLLRDRSLGERLAAQARERVRREYSPDAFRRKVNNFYDSVESQVLRGRPRASAERADTPPGADLTQ